MMDVKKLKADIEALSRHDPTIEYDGCPCCEPTAYARMEHDSYGDWIKRDAVLALFEENDGV